MANTTDVMAKSVHGTNPQVGCPRHARTARWLPVHAGSFGGWSPPALPGGFLGCSGAERQAPTQCLLQNMVEYIIRQKIYDSLYWKQDCFGLTAELLVDKGVDLRYVRGGSSETGIGLGAGCLESSAGDALCASLPNAPAPQTVGHSACKLQPSAQTGAQVGGMFGEPQKPSEFVCLILKMLQIQPEKNIIIEFIKDEEFKYLRLLGEWED